MSNARTWYSIKNAADAGRAEAFIYDEIGIFGVSAKGFIDEIRAMKPQALTVRLNTVGGSVFDGLAIYNFLKSLPDVTVKIDGLAASIGSIIAMAGKRVEMAANGFLMIHNPSSWVDGEADDMRETADFLDKIRDSLVTTYAARTGKDAATVKKWMNEETWFSAQEAKDNGFVDVITDELAMAASASVSRFAHPPAALTATASAAETVKIQISGGTSPAPTNTRKETMQTIINSLVAAKVLASAEIAEDKLADTITAAFAALTAERDTLRAQVLEHAQTEATRLVEAAVADGRIVAEKKDHWVNELLTNANARELLSAIQPANLGTEPVKVAPAAKSRETLLAEFNALLDPKARTSFWRNHKRDLLKN
jgi:ATP-dependent Clp endopeptidase proteolytic subunit ClpP